ncbi:hypothetical protein ABFY57_14025 [Paenibacillus polymyxa]|uniref:hypothetical protein n=1 Tax=Paenibacillus polymyxa TaxID=1406 RepID=UPI003D28FB86
MGEGVHDFTPGDRVVYVESPGAYAEEHIVPAHFAVRLPDAIDFEAAAAMMLKGLTAQYLLRRTFRVEAGHTVLVHAAAGGVGSILTEQINLIPVLSLKIKLDCYHNGHDESVRCYL